MPYDEETILAWGKYKFKRIKNIPAHYFLSLLNHLNSFPDEQLKEWLLNNQESIKAKALGIEPQPNPVDTSFICEKLTFATKALAKDAMERFRKRDKTGTFEAWRAYECPKCSGWHITSVEPDKFLKKKK